LTIGHRPGGLGGAIATTATLLACGALTFAAPALATFPGKNGKFVCGCSPQICTMNADGTGQTAITSFPAGSRAGWPSWSADGHRIVFSYCAPDCDWAGVKVHVMEADGSSILNTGHTGQAPVFSPDGNRIAYRAVKGGRAYIHVMNADGAAADQVSDLGDDYDPDWSPDGTKIVFASRASGPFRLYTVNPDGTGETPLTSSLPGGAGDQEPSWSPNGHKVVFWSDRSPPENQLFTINADGTGQAQLTFDTASTNTRPVWSPDGTKIAFAHGSQLDPGDPDNGFYVMNQDGTGRALISPDGGIDSWEPIVIAYPRPKGASPTRASLVVAYWSCVDPNNVHGDPLVAGSCDPPHPASGWLTVGTPPQDPANSIGSVTTTVVPGIAGTPQNEADVRFEVSVTDVRNRPTLTDYVGELETRLSLRVTDRDSTATPGGDTSAGSTVQSFFSFGVGCVSTADTTLGSECSRATSANAIAPGAVKESLRTIWELGPVEVFDGGSDGNASSTAGNTLFMTQGVFVP
jgi:Tol biopolymer transport system component